MKPTSTFFYERFKTIFEKYNIQDSIPFYVTYYDNVLNGRKLSNRVAHIKFDFREENKVTIHWYNNDILLFLLIDYEFDSSDSGQEVPEYFYFNGVKYTTFSEELIGAISMRKDINRGYFVCSHEVWIMKSYWVRYIKYSADEVVDIYPECVRDLRKN